MEHISDEVAEQLTQAGKTAVGDYALKLVFVSQNVGGVHGGVCAHAHAVKKNTAVWEKIIDFVNPILYVNAVQRTEADIFSLTFAMGAHMQINKVIALLPVKIVHGGKIESGT